MRLLFFRVFGDVPGMDSRVYPFSMAVAAVAPVVKAALLTVPSVATSFTRDEILAAEPAGEEVLAMLRRSYNAARGRDVVFVLKPYFMIKPTSGSTHATPYDYDTHVALVFFGAGVPQGVQEGRVGIDDLAPTLAPFARIAWPWFVLIGTSLTFVTGIVSSFTHAAPAALRSSQGNRA